MLFEARGLSRVSCDLEKTLAYKEALKVVCFPLDFVIPKVEIVLQCAVRLNIVYIQRFKSIIAISTHEVA